MSSSTTRGRQHRLSVVVVETVRPYRSRGEQILNKTMLPRGVSNTEQILEPAIDHTSHVMARRAWSDRDPGNGAGTSRTKGLDSQRVAPAAADLHGNGHGNGGNNGAAAGHVAEERGRAEAALAFAASIVESSDDAIGSMTRDGMITSWNAGAERLYGYTAREVIGRWPIGITIPEDELPKILERVGRGERVEHYETVGVRKDGRRVDVSVTVSPIRDTHGTIVGASLDRKSTRLNSSHSQISYAVFCLKQKSTNS